MNIFIERLCTLFVKIRIILFLLLLAVVCFACYLLMKQNWQLATAIYNDSTLVGIIGTLLGAVIGGIFTLLGSIIVGKQQIKAQCQIRRNETIYKPLYNELAEIHNSILKNSPYPDMIAFRKGNQTVNKHPQFVEWRDIKTDSRYLETPKHLARQLDRLENNVMCYLEQRRKTDDIVTGILNEVLMQETESTCSIMHIGGFLVPNICTNSTLDLFDALHHGLWPHKEVEDEVREHIQDTFLAECRTNKEIIALQQMYETWQQTEKDILDLLAAMIRHVNVAYEE